MRISGIATALPEHAADNAAVIRAASSWLGDDRSKLDLFERYLEATAVERRYFTAPPEYVASLKSGGEKARLFEEFAPALAARALSDALAASGTAPHEIEALVVTSCSMPIIPSLDSHLVGMLKLSPDVRRIPVYQYGCAGGVSGLGLSLALHGTCSRTALVSAELCSLVFQPGDTSKAQLVGAALFGDGAGAAVLSADASEGFQILAHQSHLILESRHLMGYDIQDAGPHLRLDRELPAVLARELPGVLERFLAARGFTRSDIRWWLLHPGSAKILESVESIAGIPRARIRWSFEALRDVGNLSSASILFILERFLADPEPAVGDPVLIAGIGPGLSIELLLCRR